MPQNSSGCASPTVYVIGGGLAGAEAAWQALGAGLSVVLWEMRPGATTPAHRTDRLAELVCSNSLGSVALVNAAGLLKEELRRLGSLIMAVADEHRIPAGGALAVDREGFAEGVTRALAEHPRCTLVREEVRTLPAERPLVVASGPLTSGALAAEIARLTGARRLYFYDAISPIVEAQGIDRTRVFAASRYGKGGDDYLNCPMSREEYLAFYRALLEAPRVPPHEFERELFYEGCLPIEEMAERGEDTLRFGPLKPVGLPDPRTGQEAYAVVQLRRDDRAARLWNLVGFQTKMTRGAQDRVLRLIPGLEKARFERWGSLHRNTYLESPRLLSEHLEFSDEGIFFAGQITGVEGYLESTGAGLVAGLNAARRALGRPPVSLPETTALGALIGYVTRPGKGEFQPMNANFGLLPPLPGRMPRRRRREAMSARALADLDAWVAARD